MAEVTRDHKATMLMMNGLGYTHAEIAEEVGLSESTVGKYLNIMEDEARAATDFEDVYWPVILGGVFNDQLFRAIGMGLSPSGGDTTE